MPTYKIKYTALNTQNKPSKDVLHVREDNVVLAYRKAITRLKNDKLKEPYTFDIETI